MLIRVVIDFCCVGDVDCVGEFVECGLSCGDCVWEGCGIIVSMKIYFVGGVVCDCLLQCLFGDCDWVVVGVIQLDMEVFGYKVVGKDFLVFLYLDIGEEYVLVCIECKFGCGYCGFVVDVDLLVILEDDLLWCDFIINVIVCNEVIGELVDFYGGLCDIEQCVLCYVGFVFVEDFVCVLCVVCFMVCFVFLGFIVVDEMMVLMWQIVESGEFDMLVFEWVWQELCWVLVLNCFLVFLCILYDVYVFGLILFELEVLYGVL